MSNSSKEFLELHCPDLLRETNLRKFLIALDEFITMEGLDEHDNMTDFGHRAQAVYDEIYCCNK
jgi:hypothetical protein